MSKSIGELCPAVGKKVANYRFLPMLFKWKIKGSGVSFGHSNYESVIFLEGFNWTWKKTITLMMYTHEIIYIKYKMN